MAIGIGGVPGWDERVARSERTQGQESGKNETRDVHANSIELLANALGDELLVAYPKTPGVVPTSLDGMMRSNAFFVIKVN